MDQYGGNYVGGLVGYMLMENTNMYNSILIKDCINNGSVLGASYSYVGGAIGYISDYKVVQ